MFSKRSGGFTILATAALALSAGCAGGGSGVATPGAVVAPVRSAAHAAFVDSAAVARATKIIAVSDDEDDAVITYDPSGHVLAVLSDFNLPQGLANDINGDLYVADQLNNRIQIYAPGFKGKPKTLSDPGQYPISVDSFANGKYVAVVNQYTTSNGPGSVMIYKDGVAGAPITSPSISQASFAAFDAKGNLYVDFIPTGSGCPCLGEIANATNGGTTLALLTTSNSIHPGGIQVTTTGQIAIFDLGSNTVYTYHAPSDGSLGSPVAHTRLGGSLDAPAEFAFTSDMKNLYVANNSDNNSVYEFAYPAGGEVGSISVGGNPFGVALFPKQYPH